MLLVGGQTSQRVLLDIVTPHAMTGHHVLAALGLGLAAMTVVEVFVRPRTRRPLLDLLLRRR